VSLPTRERGLKPGQAYRLLQPGPVAPYAGAWIETVTGLNGTYPIYRRSLRGSVD